MTFKTIFLALLCLSVGVSAADRHFDADLAGLKSAVPQERTTAARNLGSYVYREVVNELFLAAYDAIKSGRKANTFILNAVFESLGEVSDQTDAQDWQNLETFLKSQRGRFDSDQTFNIVVQNFDAAKTSALSQLLNYPDAKAPVASGSSSGSSANSASATLPNLAELVERAKVPHQDQGMVRGLLDSIAENHFDAAVAKYNDTGDLPNFPGRDQVVQEINQALLRLDRGHVMLTGQAGVGKTTLIKIIQNLWLKGVNSYPGEASGEGVPIVLELSILDITNPQDPSALLTRIKQATTLAKSLNRRVILFVDEAHVATSLSKNSIKAQLTRALDEGEGHVQFIWASTSSESRAFLDDKAFMRRWTQVYVDELALEQSVDAIRSVHLPRWIKEHQRDQVALAGVTDDALEYAYRHAAFEQPEAAKITGMKELIEGAIIFQLEKAARDPNSAQASLTLDISHVQEYMRSRLKISLSPGDPDFNARFEELWAGVEAEYVGNEGLKYEMQRILQVHFGSLVKEKATAIVNFGPPGSGKSYLPKVLSRHFFSSEPLIIQGAEYANGGLELNKLIGSPTGTVGSEQQRSIITEYIKNHPQGGFVVLEEADYVHKDVMRFFTNTITDQKFRDGLGKEWDVSKFIFVLNTNIGQEYLLPQGSENSMTWTQYDYRRQQMTEKVMVDGESIEVVRDEIKEKLFEKFLHTIVTSSNERTHGDTAQVAQELIKQKRRYSTVYTLSPTRADLEASARVSLEKYLTRAKEDFGVVFEIDEEALETLLTLDNFEFEKGYSFVVDQLEDKLFRYLNAQLSQRGQTVKVFLEEEEVEVEGVAHPSQTLVLQGPEGEYRQSLGVEMPRSLNPWASSEEMRGAIRKFTSNMAERIKAQEDQIVDFKRMLNLKLQDWNTRLVVSQIGTTGNGKTEFGFALAEALFGGRGAAFLIENVNTWGDLQRYFRPPGGFVDSNKETEFERWFKDRQNSGGGVIILDEMLNFKHLNDHGRGEKIAALRNLFDLLDKGILRFGDKSYDARGFAVVLTGNAMEELFLHLEDTPDAHAIARQIIERTTKDDIIRYFEGLGITAPTVARFGEIYLNGPLSPADTLAVAHLQVQKSLQGIKANTQRLRRNVDIEIDEAILQEIIARKTTVRLGMRDVSKALDRLITQPVAGILSEFTNVQSVEAKLVDGKIVWTVNDKVVMLEGAIPFANRPDLVEENWIYAEDAGKDTLDRTPSLSEIEAQPRIIFSPEQVHITAIHEVYGHWMVDVLLNGRNGTDAISLIPGEGYLGYVRPRVEREWTNPTLTSWIRKLAVLEAGHRSVLYFQIFASGAGSYDSDAQNREDDVAKIQKELESMLSNQIFEGFSEYDPAEKKRLYTDLFRRVGKSVADYIIDQGVKGEKFKEVFEKVKAERFVGGEYLDEYVASLKDSFQDKDLLFIEALASSLQNLREDLFSQKISAGNYHNFRQLFLSILPAALAEVRALREVRGDVSEQFEAALREFEDVSDAIASKIPEVQLLREPTASNGSVGARCEDMLTGK